MEKAVTRRLRNLCIATVVAICSAIMLRQVFANTIFVTATVVDGQVSISGFTSPNSTVYIRDTVDDSVIASGISASNGQFVFDVTPFSPGYYRLAVTSFDPYLEETNPYEFEFSIGAKEVLRFPNLILPPTVRTNKTVYDYDEDIQIELHGRPGAVVALEIDGLNPFGNQYELGPTGQRTVVLPAVQFAGGAYSVTGHMQIGRPSTAKTYTVLAIPSSTPTPSLTPTITPTHTPTPTLTPSPGPSATPEPPPTATPTPEPTSTPIPFIPSPTPTCEQEFGKLCFFDRDSSRTFDDPRELISFISSFDISLFGSVEDSKVARFDLNRDQVVDDDDLALFLSAVAKHFHKRLGVLRVHAKHIDLDATKPICTNVCRELDRALAVERDDIPFVERNAQIFLIFALLMLLPFIRLRQSGLARVRVYQSRGYAWFTIIYYVAVVLICGSILYKEYRAHRRLVESSRTASTEYHSANEEIRYRVMVSANRPLVVLKLYLSYDPESMQLVKLDSSHSFANVITHKQSSQEKGAIFVLGGITSDKFVPKNSEFIDVVFRVKEGEGADTSLNILQETTARSSDTAKTRTKFTPDLRIERIGR